MSVGDYTEIEVGDVIRYTTSNDRGRRADAFDYIVTAVEVEPLDLTGPQKRTVPARRIHVAVLVPPAVDARRRSVGDVQVRGVATRVVGAHDTLLRTARRQAAALADGIEHRIPPGSNRKGRQNCP